MLATKVRAERGSSSIREIARKIGVSPATVTRIESGGDPDLVSFRRVCRWLNVSAADLLGLDCSESKATVDAQEQETTGALTGLILAANRAHVCRCEIESTGT